MKKLNLIDYKLDKETYEKIAKDYVKMYTGQISSMEEIKEMLEGMSKDEYKAYNKYLDAHYTHLRNLELGFESTPPKLQDFAPKGYTFNSKLEAESLIKISNISHKLKKGEISLDVALSQYNNI